MATNGAVPSVAIFWDYENVQVPSDFPAYRVVEELRRLALNYGKLSMYRAYLDTDFMKGPRGLATRGDLQTGGVTVADTPHRNRKEVADVMIISDMLEFGLMTLDSVVILVTGDRGFSYPCQRLIDNRRTVVLVTPDTTSASNRLKESVTRVVDYRCELLGLPARQNSYRYSQEPVPIPSRSMSQSRASTSRMPVARPASLPPTCEEFATLRPSRPRDTERRNASRPINPIRSTLSARNKGKSKAAQQRPIPPPHPTKPTETLTLSDDDEDEDEDDLVQQMLAPAVRSVSIISTDSVLASPTLSKPRNPSFAPAFPSAATSNLLQPPVNRSRSRSTDPESKSIRRLPSPAPSDIQEEEDEDFDSLLIGGSKSVRKGSGSSGKTALSKKRGLESEGESAKKKKKRTSLSSATKKKEKKKETGSEDIDMFGSNEVPILVISDDEDE